jgi:hypothetical protein
MRQQGRTLIHRGGPVPVCRSSSRFTILGMSIGFVCPIRLLPRRRVPQHLRKRRGSSRLATKRRGAPRRRGLRDFLDGLWPRQQVKVVEAGLRFLIVSLVPRVVCSCCRACFQAAATGQTSVVEGVGACIREGIGCQLGRLLAHAQRRILMEVA